MARGVKVIIPKDILYDMYIVKQMTQSEIAKELGFSQNAIDNRIRDFGMGKTRAEVSALRWKVSPNPKKFII